MKLIQEIVTLGLCLKIQKDLLERLLIMLISQRIQLIMVQAGED
ncbi:hypothetical protein SMIDD28_01173 [Streptococcus mitis]|uniref:Uncharacterized protein n=1 Tax=Streptococcus mitis TaxID=28037 RepID=A0A139Q769_STRMT|nr:hypothetical protein SMIDD28_01173 [Streptococcus mitis]